MSSGRRSAINRRRSTGTPPFIPGPPGGTLPEAGDQADAQEQEWQTVVLFSSGIKLVDARDDAVLTGSAYRSQAQVLRLAQELDVRFYDHRKWWCMADRDEGLLVYQPSYVTS